MVECFLVAANPKDKQMQKLKLVQQDFMLSRSDWDKNRGVITIRGVSIFPKNLTVHSDSTGASVQFVAVGEDHPMYDQDRWDGEMQVYQPVQPELCPKVKYLVTVHEG